MTDQARRELPNECCGLLGGTGDRILKRYPLVNAAASPVEFLSSPESLFAAVKALRRDQLELIAVYHSHPTSEATPSAKDRARNYSEDVANLILSLATDPPTVRAWYLSADTAREVVLERLAEY